MPSFLTLLLTFVLVAHAWARTGYVTAAGDGSATINAGAKDGVAAGSQLPVTRGGDTIGSITVQQVNDASATGNWSAVGKVVRVGDTVVLPAATEPTATGPALPAPSGPAPEVVRTGEQRPFAGYVSAVNGDQITLGAGAEDGLSNGDTLDIMRDGKTVAKVTVGEVLARTAMATVSAPGTAIRVGDAVAGTSEVVHVTPGTHEPLPLLRDAENLPPREPPKTYSVPRADVTYDMLGALAAVGLIQSLPARVFFDDRVFRHRPDDDLVLTRRQIAELIREAMGSAGTLTDLETGPALTLKRLIESYQEELVRLGVDAEHALRQFELLAMDRMPWGLGGYLRANHVGQNVGALGEPARPQGMSLDARASFWADLANKYRFYGTVESAYDRNGVHARLDRAVLSADWDWLSVEIGKNRFWGGPGHYGSFLLTDYARPYEYVKTTLRGGDLTYQGFFTTGLRRGGGANLYGHKVEVAYSPTIRFGAAETVITTQGGLSPEYLALAAAPILPFAALNKNNPIANLYVEASVADGYQTYVEFMIDDFVRSPDETARNRTGFLFGSYWHDSDQPDRFNVRMEYARMDPGVYVPLNANERYFELGVPIGHPLAPSETQGIEMEDYRVEAQYKPNRKLTLAFGYEWANLGYEQPVPSKQTTMRLRAAYDLSHNLSAAVRYRRAQIHNVGFVAGARVIDHVAEAELFRAF